MKWTITIDEANEDVFSDLDIAKRLLQERKDGKLLRGVCDIVEAAIFGGYLNDDERIAQHLSVLLIAYSSVRDESADKPPVA